jgi:hypothetical protein
VKANKKFIPVWVGLEPEIARILSPLNFVLGYKGSNSSLCRKLGCLELHFLSC